MNTALADRTPKASLSDAALGEVTASADALSVTFHRRYRAQIEKVWAALTTPERLADWFATAEVDLRVGGTMRFDWNGMHQAAVRIETCDPPRSLAWTWAIGGRDTLVRFDLEPDADGCLLTLVHSGLSPRGGPGAGVRAGWHAHLEGFPDALNGRRTPWDVKTAREQELGDAYPSLPE